MGLHFKVLLFIRRKVDNKPIYEKQDGQRFAQQHTIKLNVNTAYSVKVVIRPIFRLQELIIHGSSTDMEEAKRDKDSDEDTVIYVTEFDTAGYDLNKKQKRKDIPITFNFLGGYNMAVTLQCKMYKEQETEHCHWGQTLTFIEYECEMKEGTTCVDIIREKHL